MNARVLWLAGAAVFLAAACPGCGGKPMVPVKGTVLKDGKALNLDKNEAITLKFMWTNEDGRELMSSVNAKHDGTFVVQGPQNKGLPPGDYKIALKWNVRTVNEDPGIDTEKIVYKDEDRLEGAFEKDKTPLKITIDRGGVEELVIDVGATPSIAKK